MNTHQLKLSIIVPFYNVEKYIAQCLDSLLNQDIPHEDYEIICIDDCSPDGSLAIVQDYMQKYDNVVLLQHSVNQRVGGGRNTGLKHAKGQYVWFVDSDDMVAENCLGCMLKLCEDNDLDVLSFNCDRVNEQLQHVGDENCFPDTDVMDGRTYAKKVWGAGLIYHLGFPYRALYRREYLNEIDNKFVEHVSFGEETIYQMRAILLAQLTMSRAAVYYHYRYSTTSVSLQLNTKRTGNLIYQQVFVAGELTRKLAEEMRKIDIEIATWLDAGVRRFVNALPVALCRTSRKERSVFYEIVKLNKKDIIQLFLHMNKLTQSILYPLIGQLFANMLAGIYKLKH